MKAEVRQWPVSQLTRHLQRNLSLLQARTGDREGDACLETLIPSLLLLAFMGGVVAGNGPARSSLLYQVALRMSNKLTRTEEERV